MKEQIRKALQKTVEEYNIWSSKSGKGYDVVKAYGELRGIVFNKLKRQLIDNGITFGHENPGYGLKTNLFPEDLDCTFTKNAALTKLMFRRPTEYVPRTRMTILSELQEQTPYVIYEVFTEDVCYEISQSVKNIQSFQL